MVDTARRPYETVECLSVCLSVPSFDSRCGVRLLSAPRAANIEIQRAPALSSNGAGTVPAAPRSAANVGSAVLTAEARG